MSRLFVDSTDKVFSMFQGCSLAPLIKSYLIWNGKEETSLKIYLISIDLKKSSGSSNIYFLAGDKRWHRQWLEVDSMQRDSYSA